MGGSPSRWLVHLPVTVIFILLQKIQKMVKCTLWYRLTQVVLEKVQRAVKWLYVCVCERTVCFVTRNDLSVIVTEVIHFIHMKLVLEQGLSHKFTFDRVAF